MDASTFRIKGEWADMPVEIHPDYTRVEYQSTALFFFLLDALEEFRGHFLREIGRKIAQHTDAVLYQRDLSSRCCFETIDKDSLQRMAYDSADILALCEQAGQ